MPQPSTLDRAEIRRSRIFSLEFGFGFFDLIDPFSKVPYGYTYQLHSYYGIGIGIGRRMTRSTMPLITLSLLLQLVRCLLLERRALSVHQSLFSYIDAHEVERTHSYCSDSGNSSRSELIYLDNDIIVYNKAYNVQSAPGYISQDSLATDIKNMLELPRVDQMIIHRLDYATSGLIVYARNEFALKDLHSQFRSKNKVYKVYSAIVNGIISSYEGEINLPLCKDIERPPLCKVDTINGKDSFTKWKIKEIGKNATHVQLQPLTGR